MTKAIQKATLALGGGVELPMEFVGHRNAILGMPGAGKSNAGVVLAEEMHARGVPWVAVDPKGDWWGIRSSADGKGAGLDVPILGGLHGDLPLSPDAGARLGELAGKGQLCGVLDTSDFDHDTDQARFMTDFGQALLKHASRPAHVYLDECHSYMPQPGSGGRLDGPAAQCVHVWKKLSLQIRFKGVGFTLLSQRPALVNKTCLYTCETLFAMRMVGKHDKAAVEDWCAQQGEAKELIKSLPLLEDGEVWLWSPQRLKLKQRFRFIRRRTYDSGRAPVFGEDFAAPELAPIKVDALREILEADAPASSAAGTKGKRGPKAPLDVSSVDAAELEGLREENRRLREQLSAHDAIEHGKALDCLGRAQQELEQAHEWLSFRAAKERAGLVSNSAQATSPPPPQVRASAQESASRIRPTSSQSGPAPAVAGLGRCARGVLTALVQLGPLSLEQAAIVAGYAPDAGNTRNSAGELRAGGYVEGANAQLQATTLGKTALGPVNRLPTGAALLDFWKGKLSKAEREILQQVVDVYPKALDLRTAASRAGYAPEAGNTRNAAGRLRTLMLVEGGNGGMVANERLVG